MVINLPCVAVYARKPTDCFGINYGMEVEVEDEFSPGMFDIRRGEMVSVASDKELYFPQLNTYNQKCFL